VVSFLARAPRSRTALLPHRDGSDVDLIADFGGGKRLTLFDKAGLEVELGELLNRRVDLCDRATLKEPVRLNAERDAVLVF
jgi:predicted nucleotidyltransferase